MALSEVICFTDPGLLGHTTVNGKPFFTSTGDVDDVACILYLAQTFGPRVTFYICDDLERIRFREFMKFLGDDVKRAYGSNFKPQMMLHNPLTTPELQPGAVVYLHAPITPAAAQYLFDKRERIARVYTQGNTADAVNFKATPHTWQLLQEHFNGKTTMYGTADTDFRIEFNQAGYASLVNPKDPSPESKAQQVYSDYFSFNSRKLLGLPLNVAFLQTRLYADTGFNGGPGNGYRPFIPLIQSYRERGMMPPADSPALDAALGPCLVALQGMLAGQQDASALRNLKDLVWLLKQYCDYDSLLVPGPDGRPLIPNMGNLGIVTKNPGCDPALATIIEGGNPALSTPLFDFAAAAYSQGVPNGPGKNVAQLQALAQESVRRFNADWKPFGGGKRNKKTKNKKQKRKQRRTRR
jgi:hypothetical protein